MSERRADSDRDEWAESLNDATLDLAIQQNRQEIDAVYRKLDSLRSQWDRLHAEKRRRINAS